MNNESALTEVARRGLGQFGDEATGRSIAIRPGRYRHDDARVRGRCAGPADSKQRTPTHPCEILRDEFLGELGLPQTELADQAGITPHTAWLFAAAFGTTPEFWMNLQAVYGHRADLSPDWTA